MENAAAEFVAKVRAHAQANYEQGGWDFVVECWDDSQILAELERAEGDGEAALAAIAEAVGVVDERRQDVRAEIF